MMHRGEGRCPSWIVGYRAFLCEQVKTNKRFSAILSACLAQAQAEKLDGVRADQAVILQRLEQSAAEQMSGMDGIGAAIAEVSGRIESSLGAVAAAQVRFGAGLADLVDAFGRMERKADRAVHAADLFEATARGRVAGMFKEEAPRGGADGDHYALFHYTNQMDPFVGRGDDLDALEAGLLDAGAGPGEDGPPPFLWTALCGEGGTGKSRLALEVLQRNRAVWSHAGFAERDFLEQPERVDEICRRLPGPTLIVIDYAAAAAADLPRFMKAWAQATRSGRHPPVRVVLIVRRQDDPVLREVRGDGVDPLADMARVSRCEMPGSPLVLRALNRRETIALMRTRMALSAHAGRIPLLDVDDNALWRNLVAFDGRRRPLFAATVADAIQRGALPEAGGGDEEARRRDLFGRHLRRQRLRYWLPRAIDLEGENADVALVRHANLVRLSTCSGGLSADALRALLPAAADGRGAFPALRATDGPNDVREALLHTMTGAGLGEPSVSSEDAADALLAETGVALGTIPALEPDLVGERFLLTEREEAGEARNWQRADALTGLAWMLSPDRTAAFLRLATQDYPTAMHELRWLPPPSKAPAETLCIRARQLRNLCSDIAATHTQGGRRDPPLVEVERLFDLADAFDDRLVNLARTDEEVRGHYGQVLRQVANIGACLANASILPVDPIAPVEEPEGPKTVSETLSRRFDAFRTSTEAGVEADGLIKGEGGSVVGLSEGSAATPLPKEMSDLLMRRLPPLAERAAEFALAPGAFSGRWPFVAAMLDAIRSVLFRHRAALDKGGCLRTDWDESCADQIARWRERVDAQSGRGLDNVAVACSLKGVLIYAAWGGEPSEEAATITSAADALRRSEVVQGRAGGSIATFVGNVIYLINQEDTAAHEGPLRETCFDILRLVADRIHIGGEMTPRQVDRTISSVLSASAQALARDEPSTQYLDEALVGFVERYRDVMPITPGLLETVAILPQGAARGRIIECLRERIAEGDVAAEDFRIPNERNLGFYAYQLAFGRPDPSRALSPDLAFDLFRLLDRTVGAKATRAMLTALPDTVDEGGPTSFALAERYFDAVRGDHGLDREDLVGAAQFAIWAARALHGEFDVPARQVDALWDATEEPAATRGRTLALWGAALILDTASASWSGPDGFAARWTDWLKAAPTLLPADLERLTAVGLGGREAEQYRTDYNLALMDACIAAVRRDMAAGGAASDWTGGEKGMHASSAMKVERALARALAKRVKATACLEEAETDLAAIRNIHERTPSPALADALDYVLAQVPDGDARREALAAECDAAREAAMKDEQGRKTQPQQTTYPPTEYSPVAPAVVPQTVEAEAEWHLPPLFLSNWFALSGEDAAEAIRRAHAANPAAYGPGTVEGITAVRRAQPSCYPGFEAVEILFRFGEGRKPISQVGLYGEERALWITGVSSGLHQLNTLHLGEPSRPVLDLSGAEQAADYLRLFCSSVHGDEGPFRIVEDAEGLGVFMREDAPEEAMAAVEPVVVSRVTGEGSEAAWTATATVLYAYSLFRSEFRILRSGNMEMVKDEQLIDDLPVSTRGNASRLAADAQWMIMRAKQVKICHSLQTKGVRAATPNSEVY